VRAPRATPGLPLLLLIVLVGGCLDIGRGVSDVAAPDSTTVAPEDTTPEDTVPDIPDPFDGPMDASVGDLIEILGDATVEDIADVADVAVDVLSDTAPPTDVPLYKGLVEWTLMIYLNGDNSLSEDAVEDLAEMTSAGWAPHVRVVVLMDTLYAGAQELVLGPDGFEVIDEPGELDLADWRVARDFALRSVVAFPAKRYGLILWNHGDGWDKPSAPGTKSFSSDDSGVAGQISVAGGELTAALEPVVETLGRPLDLLGLDMCLRGMWEVAVAVEGAAQVFIASEENEPADGWDYDGLLAQLNDAPGTDAAALAAGIVERYYGADPENSTLSAISLPELAGVSAAVAGLGDALAAVPEHWALVEQARVETQRFDDDYSVKACPLRDLYHLTERLDARLPAAPAVQAATAQVRAALEVAVLSNANQTSHPDAHGLAIHFPPLGSHFKPTYLDAVAPWSGHPWAAFLGSFGAPVCAEWTCKWHWFGGDDGCDCACGCWDPDCDDAAKTYHCDDDQICAPPGLCQDAQGACPEGATQCAGDHLLGTCVDGAWSLAPCVDLISCPDAGPPGAVCWDGDVDGAAGACVCADDPALCAGIQCGDNPIGGWCGTCRAGRYCHVGTCYEQGPCSGDDVLDCVGNCGDSDWLGDDICDDGEWDVVFNCALFGFDLGDCTGD